MIFEKNTGRITSPLNRGMFWTTQAYRIPKLGRQDIWYYAFNLNASCVFFHIESMLSAKWMGSWNTSWEGYRLCLPRSSLWKVMQTMARSGWMMSKVYMFASWTPVCDSTRHSKTNISMAYYVSALKSQEDGKVLVWTPFCPSGSVQERI